jgi:hypothetical protein
MRNFLFILLGGLIVVIVLSLLAQSGKTASKSTAMLKNLVLAPETANLIKTNEFRELVKTKVFQDYVKTLAEEQAVLVAQGLMNVIEPKG